MSWYSQYLSVFEKPFEEVPKNIISEVQNKLKQLDNEQPLVSVVLIAHNEQNRVVSCIWSLVNNKIDYPIEIIAVNNCSTDKTTEVFDTLGLTYYNETKPGPGFARQCGLDHARGKYHLCIDADSMYPPYYISTMVKTLMQPNVVAAFSLWSFVPDKKNTFFRLKIYEFLRDIHLKLQSRKRPELSVRGMAFAFDTMQAKQIGFRTDIRRGEDGSMLLELKKYGSIVFLTSKQVRVLTSSSTLNNDGSLFKSFKNRVIKVIKSFTFYFTKETKYKDEDSNLL